MSRISDSFYRWQGRTKQTQRPHHPKSATTGKFAVVWQIYFTSQTNVFGIIYHSCITAAISDIIIAVKTLGKEVKFKLEQAMKAQWGEVLDVWISYFNLDGGWWSTPRSGRFTPRKKTKYPLYRRLGGSQGQSGRMRKSRSWRDSILGRSIPYRGAIPPTLSRPKQNITTCNEQKPPKFYKKWAHIHRPSFSCSCWYPSTRLRSFVIQKTKLWIFVALKS